MTIRSLLSFAAAACLPVLVSSCAEQRDPINRVQPNALEKRFFVGDLEDPADDPEFFTRNFVVDTSKSEQLVGISTASGLERIRWQVTEDMLFARRAYSVTGGDNKGTSIDPNGDIIAAYEIEGHFDIRHDYNQSTGEELNVIDENASDRPWNQREFFRVDWSENLVNTPTWTTMFYGQVFGDIKLTSTSYFDSDPNSDDAPHFEAQEGYFDITSHFFVEPAEVNYWGFDLPMCLLMGLFTGSAIYSCDPQEAVLRSSYWRVDKADPDDDFEPLVNTSAALDILGNPGGLGDSSSLGLLTPPRDKYDPQYGYTDAGLRRYMNIHNLWKKSHQTRGECTTNKECEKLTDRAGSECLDSGTCSIPCNFEAAFDLDENGTDDQCENSQTKYKGSEGAQCSARDRCTIPYRDRDTQTLSYTVNPEMPDALQDEVSSKGKVVNRGVAEDIVFSWNQALQLAVARAREVDCRRTGSGRENAAQKRAACHAEFFETTEGQDRVQQDNIQMVNDGGWGIETPKGRESPLLVSCHNPVRDYDPEVCGEAGYRARVGDLRKNFMIYWPYDTEAPYGGIGNWRGDPLTGQILGAAATTIGPSTTRAAAQTRDIAMVALGILDIEDITDGVPAQIFQKELREGHSPKALTKAEIEHRLASINHDHLASQIGFDTKGLAASDPHQALSELKASMVTGGTQAAQQQLALQALAKPLWDTEYETTIVNQGWLVDATGLNPNTPLSDAIMSLASPLRGQDLGELSQLDSNLFSRLGARGFCMFDAMASVGNPDLYGMGNYYRAKYPGLDVGEFSDQVYEDIWKETYKGIQLHELGHSLGLLHNFTSSYDSLNYDPQYWQLRTHEGTSTASCNGEPRAGDPSSVENDSCMGPRYLDPETRDELGYAEEARPALDYFAHTSTMEYQGSRFFETVGLGQYDMMAMGALYGRVLQTFDPSVMQPATQSSFERLNRTQLDENLTVLTPDYGGAHYTELARLVGVFDPNRCRPATQSEREQAEWRIVHNRICMGPPKDYGHWSDFVDTADPALSIDPDLRAPKLRVMSGRRVPASGNVRWPYRFGGDVVNSYLHVNPFDVGADPYEVTVETIAQNQYNYPFQYFRRERRGWTDMKLPSYTARMFYERLRSYHWGISFTNSFYNEITARDPRFTNLIDGLRADDNELRPSLLAEAEMFRAITQTFLLPEPGEYGAAGRTTGLFDLTEIGENETAFSLDAFGGRFLSPSFDSSPTGGGSWQYHDYVNRAGFSVEKSMASRALTDGRAVFFSTGREAYLDGRNLNINFRSDFPEGVDRLLGGVLGEDWQTVAPYITDATTLEVLPRDIAGPAPQSPPGSAMSVFPNIGYNQQVPTIIFAHLFGRMNGDLTLSNKLRVWIDGSISGELNVPEAEQIRFTDPLSSVTYIARRFGTEAIDGRDVERGVGSRMLQRANQLLTQTYQVEVDSDNAVVLDEFGRPTLTRDAVGDPVQTDAFDDSNLRLRRYIGLLDANVQISTLIGHGPFNW